nr:MAG TPA: hypothetical protein [Caudoviricetes sp.]
MDKNLSCQHKFFFSHKDNKKSLHFRRDFLSLYQNKQYENQ